MATRPEILEAARYMIGTKYRHRGRDTKSVDCIGLIAIVSGLANTDHDTIGYQPETAVAGQLREHLERAGFVEIPVEEMRSGDLVSFHAPSNARIERHIGIVDGDRFIHVTEQTKKVTSTAFEGRWARMVHSAYRFPGVGENG